VSATGSAPGRRDLAIAAALALATAALRLPFVGRALYHWDSINFALALREFDVGRGQPHVPGYPLYVLLGRGVNLLLADAQQALAAISVVGGGLAVAALYLLGVRLFGRSVGLGAAVLLATSPLYWFYGELALPHSLDGFVVVLAVLLLWRVIAGEGHLLLPAAIWLGIAGGFRPQTQVFLLPLAAFAGWRAGPRRVLLALVALALVDLLWFVPLVELNGGLQRYLTLTRDFAAAFNSTTSVFSGGGLFGLRRNALKLAMYSLYGWGAGLPLLAVGAIAAARDRGLPPLGTALRDDRTIFLLLWVLPTVAYYQLVHMGQQGLVFVYLPALFLVSALAATALGRFAPAAVALAVALDAAVFLFAPTHPLGGDRPKLLTRHTLRHHDQDLLARIDGVRRFDPAHTAVVASESRFAQFYLPEYHLVPYRLGPRWEVNEGRSLLQSERVLTDTELGVRPDAAGARFVVLFEPDLDEWNASRDRADGLALADGRRLGVLRLAPGEGLRLGPQSFGVAPPSGAPR